MSVLSGHQRKGLRLHRTKLARDEVTSLRGIPVTTVARTILDFATQANRAELEQAINQAKLKNLPRLNQLIPLLERQPGRRGIRQLRAALELQPKGFTRSGLERRFLAFVRQAGLPMPECNQHLIVGGRHIEADCVWRDDKVIVELDARATHSSPASFENDRARDRILIADGWRPVRVTDRQLEQDQYGLQRDLDALL